jgi:hypothetical protein
MNEMQHGMSDKIKEEVVEIKPKIVDEIKDEKRAFCLHPLQVHLKLFDMSSLRAINSVFDMLVHSIQ